MTGCSPRQVKNGELKDAKGEMTIMKSEIATNCRAAAAKLFCVATKLGFQRANQESESPRRFYPHG
jgi:hypothetical protein